MPNSSSYETAISWLFQQFPSYQVIGSKAYKPTLDNVSKLSEIFGRPEATLKFIHVAGSNGKGSVCSVLSSACTEAGYKTGLFTSPHIKDFRERIRVNGVVIPEEQVVAFVEQVKKLQLDFSPSFFEITFVLALLHFKKQNCDLCIIETGLGGRLDATNIITPLCSAITSISLEHTQILGNTIAAIAEEKAGIIKEEIPVVIPESMDSTAMKVIQDIAESRQSPVIIAQPSVLQNQDQLLPEFQRSNLGIVESILAYLQSIGYHFNESVLSLALNNLYQNSGYRGRLQLIQRHPNVYLDVSHNPDGIKKTLEAVLRELTQDENLFIVYGSSSDKDLQSIATILPLDANYLFTTFNHQRSASIHQLKSAFEEKELKSIAFFEDPQSAMKKALNTANQRDTIIVLGSFFLLEDFF